MPKHKHPPAEHTDDDEGVEVFYTHEYEHPASAEDDDEDAYGYSGPSKSQLKRDMQALQDLGAELVKLNKERLAQIDIADDLRDAVKEAQRIKSHGALRRQLQYIGKLMREIDPAPIRAKLDAWQGKSNEENARFHQMEKWRDRLIADDNALAEFMSKHPHVDTQQLRTLIRNARKEQLNNQPPKSSRALFRLIRETSETDTGSDDAEMESPETGDEH